MHSLLTPLIAREVVGDRLAHSKAFTDTLQADRRRGGLPVDPEDLERVVHQAAAGDAIAWSALVRQFQRRIRAIARAHRLSAHDADDVEQNTWLRLLEHIEQVREPEKLGGWLQTTAQRESFRLLRRAGREVPSSDTPDAVGPESPLLDGLIAAERSAALAAALESVTARERALLGALIAEPGPSYADVSAALGIPVGSIGPTRGRCIERLRRDPQLAAVVQSDA